MILDLRLGSAVGSGVETKFNGSGDSAESAESDSEGEIDLHVNGIPHDPNRQFRPVKSVGQAHPCLSRFIHHTRSRPQRRLPTPLPWQNRHVASFADQPRALGRSHLLVDISSELGRGKNIVWRAFFMAIGTMLVILGVECLLIDSATLAADRPLPAAQAPAWFNPEPLFDPNRIVRPPEWIAWSLLASGAITLLYSKRWGGQ